jgi:hypothetical protein
MYSIAALIDNVENGLLREGHTSNFDTGTTYSMQRDCKLTQRDTEALTHHAV